MRIWDDRYARDLRRYQLAWRLIGHGARTETICQLTGLTPSRVRTLHKEYAAENPDLAARHRGSAPHRVDYFLSTPQRQAEAAAFASSCALMGWVPWDGGKSAQPFIPTLQQAEDFCSTFELYRALLPDPQRSQLSFEHGILLVKALASGDELRLTTCARCGAASLVEAVVIVECMCVFCRRNLRVVPQESSAEAGSSAHSPAATTTESEVDPAMAQQSLF